MKEIRRKKQKSPKIGISKKTQKMISNKEKPKITKIPKTFKVKRGNSNQTRNGFISSMMSYSHKCTSH